jgi:hypothetical protein
MVLQIWLECLIAAHDIQQPRPNTPSCSVASASTYSCSIHITLVGVLDSWWFHRVSEYPHHTIQASPSIPLYHVWRKAKALTGGRKEGTELFMLLAIIHPIVS